MWVEHRRFLLWSGDDALYGVLEVLLLDGVLQLPPKQFYNIIIQLTLCNLKSEDPETNEFYNRILVHTTFFRYIFSFRNGNGQK